MQPNTQTVIQIGRAFVSCFFTERKTEREISAGSVAAKLFIRTDRAHILILFLLLLLSGDKDELQDCLHQYTVLSLAFAQKHAEFKIRNSL